MENLKNTLSDIDSLGIHAKTTLLTNEKLYTDLFICVDDFITGIVFRSKTNMHRLSELRKLGVDIEDIHMECLERIITKLDLVLANELAYQIPYMYKVCNNIIINCYRKAIKEAESIVSLDEPLNSHEANNNDSKKSKSLNDYLMDPKASPEIKYMLKTAILDIFQKYCNNADNLLCVLTTMVFEDKPLELATLLIQEGSVDKVLATYKMELCECFGIYENEYPPVAPAKASGLSKILRKDTPNSREVSRKISNILNRTK